MDGEGSGQVAFTWSVTPHRRSQARSSRRHHASCRETRCSSHGNMFRNGSSRRQHIVRCHKREPAKILQVWSSCRDLYRRTVVHVLRTGHILSYFLWVRCGREGVVFAQNFRVVATQNPFSLPWPMHGWQLLDAPVSRVCCRLILLLCLTSELKDVFHAKRLTGRKFADPILQSDARLWPFKEIPGAVCKSWGRKRSLPSGRLLP